jgi:plasmid stabilization system protein ParE
MARVVFARRARLQATWTDAWWRENRTAAPELFSAELATAVEALAAAPNLGRRIEDPDVPGLRRLLLRSTQFHVYYEFDGAAVTILAVWSCLRGRGPDLSRPR